MKTNRFGALTMFAAAAVAVTACGGGGDGGGGTPAAQPAPPAAGEAPPAASATRPLNLTLAQGEFLEFAWHSEQKNFAQPSTTTLTSDTGRFKLTLGASVLIEGQPAFPLTVTGKPGTFAPRWTHLAMAADGSLLGSSDGAGLRKIYDAASSRWVGGGMFVDFDQSPITVSIGRFAGAYNDVPAIVAGRSAEDARCAQILGQQVCDDDATRFSEREYYTEGIGPIGFAQHLYHETDSGGFFTSTTIDKTVELIESSLAAADGTVFIRPPWDEMAPMLTARSGHAAVVYRNAIWAIGGFDSSNTALATTEIYNATGDFWTAGPPLPMPMTNISAAVAGGTILVMKDNDELFSYPTVAGGWQARTPVNASPALVDATYYRDPSLGDMLVGATRVAPPGTPSLIAISAYDVSENAWYFGGTLQQWRELLRPTVELVGSSLFVIGGFGTSGSILDERGALDTIMKFDLTTEQWLTTGAGALNVARDNPASAVGNGKIYVFGGNPVTCNLISCTPGAALRDAEVFDPATDQSTELKPMLYPRMDAEAVTLNGLIYVIGGRSNGTSLRTVERLTPP